MIYLDNAATTLRKPPCVAEAVVAALGSFGNSGRGAHEESLSAGRIIYDARVRLGRLFHADPERADGTGLEERPRPCGRERSGYRTLPRRPLRPVRRWSRTKSRSVFGPRCRGTQANGHACSARCGRSEAR